MSADDFNQIFSVVVAVVWLVFAAVAVLASIGKQELPLYTEEELSQMLMTENKKHQPRPRLRAGEIQETP